MDSGKVLRSGKNIEMSSSTQDNRKENVEEEGSSRTVETARSEKRTVMVAGNEDDYENLLSEAYGGAIPKSRKEPTKKRHIKKIHSKNRAHKEVQSESEEEENSEVLGKFYEGRYRKPREYLQRTEEQYEARYHRENRQPTFQWEQPNKCTKFTGNYHQPHQHMDNSYRYVNDLYNTLPFRPPIDRTHLPTFGGNRDQLPPDFLEDLERWFEENFFSRAEQLLWARRCLQGKAKLWFDAFCDVQTYGQFKEKFLKQFWNTQNDVLKEIYNGDYLKDGKGETMSTYFLRIWKKASYQEYIDTRHLLGTIIEHFPESTAKLLSTIKPQTAENIYNALEQFENIEYRKKYKYEKNSFEDTNKYGRRLEPQKSTENHYQNYGNRNNGYERRYSRPAYFEEMNKYGRRLESEKPIENQDQNYGNRNNGYERRYSQPANFERRNFSGKQEYRNEEERRNNGVQKQQTKYYQNRNNGRQVYNTENSRSKETYNHNLETKSPVDPRNDEIRNIPGRRNEHKNYVNVRALVHRENTEDDEIQMVKSETEN